MTDPRLSDTRIKAPRSPVWDQDDSQWDNNTLRPGFTERLAPYDPNPEYSALDNMDGLDETTNPPFPPVRAETIRIIGPLPEPHTGLGVGLVAATVLLVVVAVLVLAALGFAWIAGWLA